MEPPDLLVRDLPLKGKGNHAYRLVEGGVDFVIPPTVRFAGEPGEQATMFLLDPAGNALEFKAMADPTKLFARESHKHRSS